MCASHHVLWYSQYSADLLDTAGLASQSPSTGGEPSDHTQASTAEAAASSSNGGSSSGGGVTVRNIERSHWAQPWRKNSAQLQSPVCTLELPDAGKGWKGPRLNLSLPSFRCAWSALCYLCCISMCSLAAAIVKFRGHSAPTHLPVQSPKK